MYGTGMPEHIFEWGAGDALEVHMGACTIGEAGRQCGVRGGAPETFCNLHPILQ